ncbi:MAG: hypothetical protein FWC73_08455 [Defluviitaleaceae bacterium]|nr:hypothetical protein [Defluviitaleaceae bacterium]
MTAYELMIKTNHHLIRGGEYNEAEKADIAHQLRANRVTDGRMRTFNPYAYPKFYFPPHNNGKKLQTVVPISPKTNIVADNAYEYEIIRLLHLFQPDDDVSHMIDVTLNRLKKTCFGYESCHYAECFEAGLAVLRFLSFAALHDMDWIGKQISVYNNHFADNKRHSGVQRYFWYILSDMPIEIAEPEILRQKEIIIDHINHSYTIKNGNEDILLYVMRNTLARLPEFSYIKNRKPYVDEKNGRWKFDIK